MAYIGKCKKCGKAQRHEEIVLQYVTKRDAFGRDWKRPYRVRIGSVEISGTYLGKQATIPCTCGAKVKATKIDGHTNEQPCDARCTNATGHKCECSCGGANHGSAHA